MINHLTTGPPALLHLALLASVKSPLLRVGLHFLPRATLIFCVDVVPPPRYVRPWPHEVAGGYNSTRRLALVAARGVRLTLTQGQEARAHTAAHHATL